MLVHIVYDIMSVAEQAWIHATDPPCCNLNSQDSTDVRVSFEAGIPSLEASTIAIAAVNFAEEPRVGVNLVIFLPIYLTLHIMRNRKVELSVTDFGKTLSLSSPEDQQRALISIKELVGHSHCTIAMNIYGSKKQWKFC